MVNFITFSKRKRLLLRRERESSTFSSDILTCCSFLKVLMYVCHVCVCVCVGEGANGPSIHPSIYIHTVVDWYDSVKATEMDGCGLSSSK